ncbi:MAG: hypothetical protein RIS85_2111 [Pseudomonadota bacterium]|jgi:hypothetical protein
MEYLAAFFAIWLLIAVVIAIPVGKALHKLGRNDANFEAEHTIWACGETFRDIAMLSSEDVENNREPSKESSAIAA